ncbi:MAG TPA: GMC family oxidoreductase [Gemmatimonadaceae bacterium]|nr:GMC family oxidoreductase [Gemmatimonadaceae bacterium]
MTTQPGFPDPIAEGIARGWRVHDGATLAEGTTFEADVAIVGTGAGGGVTAEILSAAGLKVLLLEEGGLRSTRDFRMLESEAYPTLYQESASRKTKDKGINIMQGRTVGGSTVVNWTSSFRTPPSTLAHWREHYGLADLTPEALAPWWQQMERRLRIAPWGMPPNRNNQLLADALTKLGIAPHVIPRNVNGCYNLGYCGMGCPTNAKQSMLVTTLPAALEQGAELLYHARAERLAFTGSRVQEVVVTLMGSDGFERRRDAVRVRARHVVLAGGAINTPALLLRSRAPDPHRLIGKRTFLHPVTISLAIMADPVDGFAGAPQSIYSDHFNEPSDAGMGFKLEAPPIHPVLMASTAIGLGAEHAAVMKRLRHVHVVLALLRDGLHSESTGGTVELRDDGTPVLDYPLSSYVMEGARRALTVMAELQFAAGAPVVIPFHERGTPARSAAAAKAQIAALAMRPPQAKIVSAHVMGGCPMAADERRGVTDSFGRVRHVDNLSVIDGSLFPTSVGANPQLSIYGLAARAATALARSLGGTA